ncbi:MAG: calcium-binding protein [Pseudomonadota bacterium]
MLTLTATDAGFHNVSPLGTPLAPNVILRTQGNIDGAFVQDPVSGVWQSAESGDYAGWNVRLEAAFTEAPAPDSTQATLSVEGLVFTRIDAGEEVETGRLSFGGPISVDVLRAGAGAPWEGTAADEIEAVLRADGLLVEGGAGIDVFALSTPVLPIRGPVTIFARGGDDSVEGTLADDIIYGGTGDDSLADEGGRNEIWGQAGHDIIALGLFSERSMASGGAGDDRLSSLVGHDRLLGEGGDDVVLGGGGNDALYGQSGSDVLNGGAGRDRLIGGRGDDDLTGAEARDVFIFAETQNGLDAVTDFAPEEDLIRIRGSVMYDDLEISDHAEGTLVSWDDGKSGALLAGLSPDQISTDMFLF